MPVPHKLIVVGPKLMKQLYINGQWQDATNSATWNVLNPATEEPVDTIAFGNAVDAYLAIGAAKAAFASWSLQSPWARAEILKRAADYMRSHVNDFAKTTTLESGKPLAESKGEWQVAANLFEWFAEEGKRSYGRVIPSSRTNKRMQVIYQPMGPVGIITAWNFPAYNPARATAAALAAGCSVVLKPSEFTPFSALQIVEALEHAGVPPGVCNLLVGEAESIGQALLQSPDIKKISFTGSTRVGKILMDGASQTHKKLALELGGNAPVIIMPDVDVDELAKTAVTTKLRNCGQVCVAPQRFYVHEKIFSAFVERAQNFAQTLKVGNGLEADTRVGPLINRRQQQQVVQAVAQAIHEGNELLVGGQSSEKGYFVSPAIIRVNNPQSPFLANEIFGPILPIISFANRDEALSLANATSYGLAAYVWTTSLQDAIYLSERLEFGMVGINEWAPHAAEAPFGGWKKSGVGHESGSEGLFEYLEKKLISIGGL